MGINKSFFKCFTTFIMIMCITVPTLAFAGGTPSESKVHNETKIDDSKLEVCPEPRPELCTMNYLPVCAQLRDGSFKTYANGCNSCNNTEVVGYRDGECESK